MRSLRWKNQYTQGSRDVDQRHKRLLGCFNQLMETAGQKEHCQEMELFLIRMAADLDSYLRNSNADNSQNNPDFYTNLVNALPLQPYGSNACRNCGLCDVAKAKIAEHLQAPLDCLQDPEHKQAS